MMGSIERLKSGDLRTRIEIMRNLDVDNGKGGYTSSWSTIATPWAEVMGQDGRESVIGHALQGISTYRIRLRFRSNLKPADQVRLGGAGGIDLNIMSITDPTGRREQLMIIASTASAVVTS